MAEPLRHYVLAEDYHQGYLKEIRGYCHINIVMPNKPLVDLANMKPTDDANERTVDAKSNDQAQCDIGVTFHNTYNATLKKEFIDVTTGEPLFLLVTGFESGVCGYLALAGRCQVF